jgi:hypothetical protein
LDVVKIGLVVRQVIAQDVGTMCLAARMIPKRRLT